MIRIRKPCADGATARAATVKERLAAHECTFGKNGETRGAEDSEAREKAREDPEEKHGTAIAL